MATGIAETPPTNGKANIAVQIPYEACSNVDRGLRRTGGKRLEKYFALAGERVYVERGREMITKEGDASFLGDEELVIVNSREVKVEFFEI